VKFKPKDGEKNKIKSKDLLQAAKVGRNIRRIKEERKEEAKRSREINIKI
jgi:hypothetical protein